MKILGDATALATGTTKFTSATAVWVSNTATSAISEANSYRVELLLNGLNRKKNSLLKKGIRDEKKKAIAYPWI